MTLARFPIGILGAIVLALPLAASASSEPPSPNDLVRAAAAPPSQEMTTPAEFRRTHPAPPGLDAVLARYRRVQQAYLEAIRNGGTSRVALHAQNGTTYRGHDDELWDGSGRVREIRDNYEAIAVGQRSCYRQAGVADWECKDGRVEYGLEDVEPDAVVRAAMSEEDCAGTACLRIEYSRTEPKTFNGVVYYSERADLYGWDVTLLVRSSDDRLLRKVIVSRDGPGRQFSIERDYSYDTGIEPIDLPEAEPNAAPSRDPIKPAEPTDGHDPSTASAGDPEMLAPRAFRRRFPAPADLAKARRLYANAAAAFEAHSRQGMRSAIRVVLPDGHVSQGTDSMIGAPPGRMHEDRDDYDMLAVGQHYCRAEGRSPPWTCRDGFVNYGMLEVFWEAVTRFELDARDCDGQPCRHLRIDTANVEIDARHKVTAVSADPEHFGATFDLLLRASDDLPIHQSTIERLGPQGEIRSESDFSFDVEVGPIELPVAPSAGS